MVIKWNVNLGIKIQLEGIDIEEVERFVYLDATVTTSGSAGEDMCQAGKSTSTLLQLKEHLEEQLRIFQSSVLAVLLYVC